jgi:GTP-binding protein
VPVLFVSAATGEGVPELMKATRQLLKKIEKKIEPEAVKVFHPQPRHQHLTVEKEGDIFVVISPDIERIAARIDLTDPSIRWQLRGLLIRKGMGRLLEKAGIKGGDKVRCGNAEWDW